MIDFVGPEEKASREESKNLGGTISRAHDDGASRLQLLHERISVSPVREMFGELGWSSGCLNNRPVIG